MPTTVSIVEDDPTMRAGWVNIINHAPGFRCIADYGSAEEAIAGIPRNPPEVVLMDINLPGLSGIECVRELKPKLPSVDFVMLTMFGDQDRIFDALKAGAIGYLLKSKSTPAALIKAIKEVKVGGSPMSGEIARQVTLFFREPALKSKAASTGIELLLRREYEVLELLAAGRHYKEIGVTLFISVDTVRTHIRHIYEKLQVHSRAEAAAKFFGR
ncbi:MAG: response regulator transcription factor [Fibrobacteres bacterium]|nr:response regulator transcription factor [Fibrobacterota bacterium]